MRHLAFLFFAFLLISCKDKDNLNNEFSYLPEASGGFSTLNVIADEKLWNAGLKPYLVYTFEKEIEGLLNYEKEFDSKKIRSKAFNRLFKRQRYLLIFITSKKVKNPNVNIRKDIYAQGQIIVQVSGRTNEEAIQKFQEKQTDIYRVINEHRIKIIQKLAENRNNKKLEETLANSHGINLTIPQSYNLAIDTTNFFYATKKTELKCEKFNHGKCYVQTGIFTYWFEYKSSDIFNPERFIMIRDSITKQYIEGTRQKETLRSYMKVYDGLPLTANKITLNGKFGYQIKGWWDLENGTMGGPFVSVAYVDEMRNRVIISDAFVFGPNFNKRRFIKELEAMCLSLRALGE